MAGKTVAKKLPEVITRIDQSEVRIQELLPPGLDAKRVVRLAKLAIHANPGLLKCKPVSVLEAVLQASQLGLEIGSPIGGAHLVPFGQDCQLVIDYRALIRLALQGGSCRKVVARAVYADDHFEILQGSEERLVHVPYRGNDPRLDENITDFYAIATLEPGITLHEWRPRSFVDGIRGRVREGNQSPWKSDYAAMGKKTLVKQLVRWLDVSPRLATALEFDNRGEGYSAGQLDTDTPASIQAHLATKAAETAEKLKARVIQGEPIEEDDAQPEE